MRFDPNFFTSVLDGIKVSDAAFQTAEQQMSTGLRVNVASDDPQAAAELFANQAQLAQVDQYTINITSAQSRAQTAYSALSSVVSLLTQAVSLGANAANATNTGASPTDYATQLKNIISSVAAAANTTFGGVAIFGGSSGSGTAFVADPSSSDGYTYTGSSNASTAQIGQTLTVQTAPTGSSIFASSSASVFGALNQMLTALASGSSSQISSASSGVSSALKYVSEQQASLGGTINLLGSQESYLGQEKVTLNSQQSSLVDISAATAIENVNAAQVQNSAVFAAAAKILPQSLLNYLK